MAFDFDLFVIGGGSGGVRAARLARTGGAKVGLAEEFRYGGTCVIRGCVPKKLLVYASSFSQAFDNAKGFGWSIENVQFDWPNLIAAKNIEIDRLEGLYRQTLGNAKVQMFDARATLLDAHQVKLSSGETFSSKHILVATGGTPFVPDIPGREHIITSNEVFDLPEIPARCLIVGGGYIACEFASILNGLGSRVTQLYRGKQILRGFDGEVQDFVARAMIQNGVDLHVGSDVASIKKTTTDLEVHDKGGRKFIVDQVLYATGRLPNSADIGLEKIGVALDAKGAIKVDAYSQTAIPSIYAVGDVTNRVNLTPVAIREAAAFHQTVFLGQPTKADHALIPTAVFTQPEVGTVGLSEEAAIAQEPVAIYQSSFRPMLHILAQNPEKMLIKLIVSQASRRVLGCHIVGHGAGEMIQMAAVAIKMGATKEDFDRTVAVHPTAAEELVTLKTPVMKG